MRQNKLKILAIKILTNVFVLTVVILVFYFIGQTSRVPQAQAEAPRCQYPPRGECAVGTPNIPIWDGTNFCWAWTCSEQGYPPEPCCVVECGDGNISAGEDCDGSNLNGKTCVTQGFTGGTLRCNSSCQFNTTDCVSVAPTPPSSSSSDTSLCGTSQQVCVYGFTPSPAPETCITQGFAGGILNCDAVNCRYDTHNCTGTASNQPLVSGPDSGSNCKTFSNCDEARVATARCIDGSSPEVIPPVGTPDCTVDCSWTCTNVTNGGSDTCTARNTFSCNKPGDTNPDTMGVNNQFVSQNPFFNMCYKNGKKADECASPIPAPLNQNATPYPRYEWTCDSLPDVCFACPKAECLSKEDTFQAYQDSGVVSCKSGTPGYIDATFVDSKGNVIKLKAFTDINNKIDEYTDESGNTIDVSELKLINLTWKCTDTGNCASPSGVIGSVSCSIKFPYCGNGVIDPGEECDDGVNNSLGGRCSPDCKKAFCGDGTVQRPNFSGANEECDPDQAHNSHCTAKALTEAFDPNFGLSLYDTYCEKDNGNVTSKKGLKSLKMTYDERILGECKNCLCKPVQLTGTECLVECGADALSQAGCDAKFATRTKFDPATCLCKPIECLTDEDCASKNKDACVGDLLVKTRNTCDTVTNKCVPKEEKTDCTNLTGKGYNWQNPYYFKCDVTLYKTILGTGFCDSQVNACDIKEDGPLCKKSFCGAECSDGESIPSGFRNLGVEGTSCFIYHAYEDKKKCNGNCIIENENSDGGTCGNGIVEGKEECDNGDLNGTDTSYCDSQCFRNCGIADNAQARHINTTYSVEAWEALLNNPDSFCGSGGTPRKIIVTRRNQSTPNDCSGPDYVACLTNLLSTGTVTNITWSCSDLEPPCYKCGVNFPGCNPNVNNKYAYMSYQDSFREGIPTGYHWEDFENRFNTVCTFIYPLNTLVANCSNMCSGNTPATVTFNEGNYKWEWQCGQEKCQIFQMGCGTLQYNGRGHQSIYHDDFSKDVQQENVGCLNGGTPVIPVLYNGAGWYGYKSESTNRSKALWRCEYPQVANDTDSDVNPGNNHLQAPRTYTRNNDQIFYYDSYEATWAVPITMQDSKRWCAINEVGQCPSKRDSLNQRYSYNLTWDGLSGGSAAPRGDGLWPGNSNPLSFNDFKTKVEGSRNFNNSNLCKNGIARLVTLNNNNEFPTTVGTTNVKISQTLGKWILPATENDPSTQIGLWDHTGYAYYSADESKAFWVCDRMFDEKGQYSGNTDNYPVQQRSEICYAKIAGCQKPPHGVTYADPNSNDLRYSSLSKFKEIFQNGSDHFFASCFHTDSTKGLVYGPSSANKSKCDLKLCEAGSEVTNFNYYVPTNSMNTLDVVSFNWECSGSVCKASSTCQSAKKISSVSVTTDVAYTCNGNTVTYKANYEGNCDKDKVRYYWNVYDADNQNVNVDIYGKVTTDTLTLSPEDQFALGKDSASAGRVEVEVTCDDPCADITAGSVRANTKVIKTYDPSISGTIDKDKMCTSQDATITYTIKDGVEANGEPICTLTWEENNFDKINWSNNYWNTAIDSNDPKINGKFLIKKTDPGFLNGNSDSDHYPANWRYRAKMTCACNPEKKDISVINEADNSELFYLKIGPSYGLNTTMTPSSNQKVCLDNANLSLMATESNCKGSRTFTWWKQGQDGNFVSIHSEGPIANIEGDTSDDSRTYDISGNLVRGDNVFRVRTSCDDQCSQDKFKDSEPITVTAKQDNSTVKLEPADQQYCQDETDKDSTTKKFIATYEIDSTSLCSAGNKNYSWSLYKSETGCKDSTATDVVQVGPSGMRVTKNETPITDISREHNLAWMSQNQEIPAGTYWLGVNITCIDAKDTCVKDQNANTCVKVVVKPDQTAEDKLELRTINNKVVAEFCAGQAVKQAVYTGKANCQTPLYYWTLTKPDNETANYPNAGNKIDLFSDAGAVGNYNLKLTVDCNLTEEPCFNIKNPTSEMNFIVKPQPTLEVIAGSDNFCSNVSADYATTANECDQGKITWTLKDKSDDSFVGTTQVYTFDANDSKNSAYTVKKNLPAGNYALTAELTCDNPCQDNVTQTKDIVIKPLPKAGTIASGQSICSGDTPEAFVSRNDGENCLSYRWESATLTNDFCNDDWGTILGSTSSGYQPGPLTASACYHRVCVGECGEAITDDNLVIKVTPNSETPTVTLPEEACQDNANFVAPTLTYSDDNKPDCKNLSYRWSVDGQTVTDNNADDTTFDTRVLDFPASLTVTVTCEDDCPKTKESKSATVKVYDCTCGTADSKNFVGGTENTLSDATDTGNFRFCKSGCDPVPSSPLSLNNAGDGWDWQCRCGGLDPAGNCSAKQTKCGTTSSESNYYTDTSWNSFTKTDLCANSTNNPSGQATSAIDDSNDDEPNGNSCNGGGNGTGIKDIWKWNCVDSVGGANHQRDCSVKRLDCGVASAERVIDKGGSCKVQPYDATDGYRGSYNRDSGVTASHRCNWGDSTGYTNTTRGKWWWECVDSLDVAVQCEARRDCGWAERSAGDNAKYATVDYGTEGCWTAEDVGVWNNDSVKDMVWGRATRFKLASNDPVPACTTTPLWKDCKRGHCAPLSATCNTQGVCPANFTLPTDAQWHDLENALSTGNCNRDLNVINTTFICGPAGNDGDILPDIYSDDGLKDLVTFAGVSGRGYWTKSQKASPRQSAFCNPNSTSCFKTLPYYQLNNTNDVGRNADPNSSNVSCGGTNGSYTDYNDACLKERVRCIRPATGDGIIGGGGGVERICYGFGCI